MIGRDDQQLVAGDDPLALLASFAERRRGSLRRGDHRSLALSEELGGAHRRVRAIHVAGTDGKTSVVRMIASLLRELGVRAGDTTSPHLHHLAERIRIDTEPASRSVLVAATAGLPGALQRAEERVGEPPTFFDVITAVALRAFAETDRELAVVEAGIGGCGDATAIVSAPVAVLAPIGLDHVELGTTYAEVAANKAGIIRPGATVLSAAQQPAAGEVLRRAATANEARLIVVGSDIRSVRRQSGPDGQHLMVTGLGGHRFEVVLPVHGAAQADNAALALAAVQVATGCEDLDPRAVRAAFAQVRLPGRTEVLISPGRAGDRLDGGSTVVVDGAHDPLSSNALAAMLEERFPGQPITLVVGTSGGRDPLTLLRPLVAQLGPRLRSVVATSATTRGATPAEVVADRLRDWARGASAGDVPPVAVAATVSAAMRDALDGVDADGVVVATGSLYLAAEARHVVATWGQDSASPAARSAPFDATCADDTVRA